MMIQALRYIFGFWLCVFGTAAIATLSLVAAITGNYGWAVFDLFAAPIWLLCVGFIFDMWKS